MATLSPLLSPVIGIINRYLERKTVFAVVIETCWNTIIFLDIVQGQGNSSECQKFAVHDEVCRVMGVANLRHEGGFPCACKRAVADRLSSWLAEQEDRNNLSKTGSFSHKNTQFEP